MNQSWILHQLQLIWCKIKNIEVGSGIQSIVAGPNITVDATDPLNPIVSATGGGSGGGSNLTLEQARQNGNVLEGEVEIKEIGKNFWIKGNLENDYYFLNASEGAIGLQYYDETTGNTSGISVNEKQLSVDSNNPEHKGLVGNQEFNKQGDRKAFAQIADLQDGFIPLTGTEEGKPVTGSIEIEQYIPLWFKDLNQEDRIFEIIPDDGSWNFRQHNSDYSFDRNINIGNAFGIISDEYFGATYVDNSYIQKKYVDQANSYSTEETKTGGTWTNGKPIYRRVFYDTLSGGTPVGDGSILTKIIDINIEKIVTSQTEFVNSGGGIIKNPSSIQIIKNPSSIQIIKNPSSIQILKNLSSSPYIIQYPISNSSGFYELILEYTKNTD